MNMNTQESQREVVFTTPDGSRAYWGLVRRNSDETQLLLRARDWARRMYGQDSPVVETVRIEPKP